MIKERIERNQWWLLLTLGMAAFGGGWLLTKNLMMAIGTAILVYFVISLKKAATWTSFWLLLSASGLGTLLAQNVFSAKGKVGLGLGAIGGFLGGFLLLALLASIRKKAGGAQPAVQEVPQEGLRVTTSVEGVPLIHTALQGPKADTVLGLLDEEEIEGLKRALLNPVGQPTSRQIAEVQGAAQRGAAKKRRGRFPKIGFGKRNIPRS